MMKAAMAKRETPTDRMAFSIQEAARLGHVSEWQLRDWSNDLYRPHWKSGLFTFRDLLALRTLSSLREKVSRHELRRAGAAMRKHYAEPWSRLRVGVGPKNRIYFADPKTGAWLSADGIEQRITPEALDHIAEQLERDVRHARQRDPRTYGKITRTRGVCGSRPRVDGTRITVDALRPFIDGSAPDRVILQEFPTLCAADIMAVRNFLAAA